MSTVGPGGIPSISIAQSLATSQRSDGPEAKADANAAATAFEQRASAMGVSGDVADVDMSADRDADGRMPWQFTPPPEGSDGEPTSDPNKPSGRNPLPPDPHGKLGQALDREV